MGCVKTLLRGLALLCLLGLAAAWLALRFIGEGSMLTGSALFLPAYSWILPGLALALAGLIFDRKMALAMLAGVLVFAWAGMGFRLNSPRPAAASDLTVVSGNLGIDASAQTLEAFVKQQQPDVICVQEAYGRLGEMRRTFPGYEARSIDQFPILSRLPIVGERVIELQVAGRREPCAARYELDYHGERIAVYNVHLPTPRRDLKLVWDNLWLLQPFRLTKRERRLREILREGWTGRAARIEELRGILRAETLPMIVAGDFNMPSLGRGYARVSANLRDAFAEGGRGFGWTFPCDRMPPLRRFTPWLRIDYQFASRDWRVCEATVEAKRQAQHLATAARYRLEK